MPIERDTIIERPASSETVVVDGGSSFGVIGWIITAVFVVILVIWLVNGGISTNADTVNIDLPNVTVSE